MSKEHSGFITLRAAIEELRQTSPHRKKLDEASLVYAWKQVVPEVARLYTAKLFYKRPKLFVYITSASLRHTLQMNKNQLIEQLNDAAPGSLVEEIVWI